MKTFKQFVIESNSKNKPGIRQKILSFADKYNTFLYGPEKTGTKETQKIKSNK